MGSGHFHSHNIVTGSGNPGSKPKEKKLQPRALTESDIKNTEKGIA